MFRIDKYLILIQLMLLNVIGQDIIKCSATIQTEKIATEQDLELINATQLGKREIVEALIKQGANVNVVDVTYGDTALIRAAYNNQKEILELLIQSKADIDAKYAYKYTALVEAARMGYEEIVELLIKHNANVNFVDKDGWTALIYAVDCNRKTIVELLLRAGANMEHKNELDEKAMDLAGKFGYLEIVKILEDEPTRRETVIKGFIENNKKWISENMAKKITAATSAQLIPEISNIIAQYAMEYTEIPLEYRLNN